VKRSIGISLALAACAACSKDAEPRIEPGAVQISPDVIVRTDTVGDGAFATQATFVLVDADNVSGHELSITLGGDLLDATGKVVDHLRPESLRVGLSGHRTFVLVDRENRAAPTAVSAKIVVVGAEPPPTELSAHLSDIHAFDDHGKVMIAGNLTNDAERPGQVMVLAGFHDADGKPMVRQWQVVALAPGATQVVRFEGPDGSRKGALWLGEASY
jgi:hypothetical protein